MPSKTKQAQNDMRFIGKNLRALPYACDVKPALKFESIAAKSSSPHPLIPPSPLSALLLPNGDGVIGSLDRQA